GHRGDHRAHFWPEGLYGHQDHRTQGYPTKSGTDHALVALLWEGIPRGIGTVADLWPNPRIGPSRGQAQNERGRNVPIPPPGNSMHKPKIISLNLSCSDVVPGPESLEQGTSVPGRSAF